MPKRKLNVIIVGIDTLRYDHLGFSGYPKNTSPNIDKLADESLVFNNCFSQAPTTGPSFASILTSRYPTFHGLVKVWTKGRGWKLAQYIPTLPEILKKNGYTTAAFTEGGTLSHHIGLSKGFDIYETNPASLIDADRHPAAQWIGENKGKPFFLFFHTFAAHAPYLAPSPFIHIYGQKYEGSIPSDLKWLQRQNLSSKTFRKIMEEVKYQPEEVEHLKTMYDECVTYIDNFIGKFLNLLRLWKLDENTILIFTSDHGEEFMEHGNISHQNIYDEILHVPLIIKIPEVSAPKNIDQIVRSIDIMPTVLDVLDIQTEEILQGTSLLPVLRGIDLNLKSLAEYGYSSFSLRNKYYKYIFRGKADEELYNIGSDPLEKKNLAKYSLSLVENLHNDFQTELTKNRLIRPPHNMFILKNQNTVENIKSNHGFDWA